MSRRRWNPTTRGIYYNPTLVADACRRMAQRARLDGDEKGAQQWENEAVAVESGSESPRDVAADILMLIEMGEDA